MSNVTIELQDIHGCMNMPTSYRAENFKFREDEILSNFMSDYLYFRKEIFHSKNTVN